MITVQDLELRAGARLLMDQVSFRIDKGDKIGLVGRNGAGKTTLTRVLAGEGLPAGGKVTRSGEIGYLPQDPRTPDMEQLARDRILSARGLDIAVGKLRQAHEDMASEDADVQRKAMNRYDRLESEFLAAGGYAAEAEAAAICSNLALPDRLLNQPLKTLSGGQRRRVELARILYSDAETMLLDEPTNHLDADSIAWLRDFLKNHQGGLIVISHDTELLEATVNKVFLLDANRAQIDFYNMDWKRYLQQRETDERARKRERANAEKKAQVLFDQANKMRAKATKAVAAQNMAKRAERLLGGLEAVRENDRVAALRFPDPSPCGKTPLTADGLSKSYGSLEIFTDVDLAIDRGSKVVILGLNGAGKTTLLRMLAGVDKPDTGEVDRRPRPEGGLLRPGARDARRRPHRPAEHALLRPGHERRRSPRHPGLVPVLRRRRRQARRCALRRREDPPGPGHHRGLERQRAAPRRAHQQPRPGQPRRNPRGPEQLHRRRRPGQPR